MLDSVKASKIRWQCRRGMLELDLLLNSVLENQFERMTAEHVELFENLLNYSDPELFAWLMGHEEPQDDKVAKIVKHIKSGD